MFKIKMKKRVKREYRKKRRLEVVFFSIFVIVLIGFVLAKPVFHTTGITYNGTEDQSPIFTYNITNNVTNVDNETLRFELRNITSNPDYGYGTPAEFNWFSLNISSGIMTINTTADNQSGKFNVTVLVEGLESSSGDFDVFYFIMNATNDFPNFTNIAAEYNLTYNLTSGDTFEEYLNASDEENHYPLNFNVSFYDNCSLASWSNRGNCTLLTPNFSSNYSALMNYTPSKDDVGVYFANISVSDYGQNYNCSSGYCAPDYSQNKTTYYSKIVVFNVFSSLNINVTSCNNTVFQEGSASSCYVNITTGGLDDVLNLSSDASLRNYDGSISNTSWFYNNNVSVANNYSIAVLVSFTPEKSEIGNWSINFTAYDRNFNNWGFENILIFVNRTTNDVPELKTITNYNTSADYLTTINFTVYDDDLLIPDKNLSFGGFNETINFTSVILNRTDLTQVESITDFEIEFVRNIENRSEARVQFIPSAVDAGDYTINISVRDVNESIDFQLFNFTINANQAPLWVANLNTSVFTYEDGAIYLNLSKNVTDPDDDSLTFTYSNDTSFPTFSMDSSSGVISFVPIDVDVGQHIIVINVSDGFLVNSSTFNFTIHNLNDTPVFKDPILQTDLNNATVDAESNMQLTEDNITTFSLWIRDDDFKIPNGQRSDFYSEDLDVNFTIQGPNINLFSFTEDTDFPTSGSNSSKYIAIFTPAKEDVGNYNITINVTDNSGAWDSLKFNLTVSELQHDPVLMDLSNQTSAENRSFYYQINVSDDENGYSNVIGGNTNFTFNYTFLSGSDFIIENQTIFNTTSGVFNLSFNNSQGGRYHINISVNDSTNRQDYDDFWIFVYDVPVVKYPLNSYAYKLAENYSYNITFHVNHSILDNLTFLIYIENNSFLTILKNFSFYGDNTNLSWLYQPNFTQEISDVKNLTLIAYPTNTDLSNRILLNVTSKWDFTINHTNQPINFSGFIGGSDEKIIGGSPQLVNLTDYFSDADANDKRYNQTIKFLYDLLNSSGGGITVTLVNWTNESSPYISFSSTSSGVANYTVFAYEYNISNYSQIINDATSNNFSVQLTVQPPETEIEYVTVEVPSGGTSRAVAFRLIAPGFIDFEPYTRVRIPIKIKNTGNRAFSSIALSTSAYANEELTSLIDTSLDIHSINSLSIGQTKNFTLDVYFNTNDSSKDYKIKIDATSGYPSYSDEAYIEVSHKKIINITDIQKYILFTEEFIVENPECLELKELVDEAKELFEKGDYGNARLKAEQAVNACKDSIEQVSLPSFKSALEYGVSEYLVFATLGSLLLGLSYYFVKRRRLRKAMRLRE